MTATGTSYIDRWSSLETLVIFHGKLISFINGCEISMDAELRNIMAGHECAMMLIGL